MGQLGSSNGDVRWIRAKVEARRRVERAEAAGRARVALEAWWRRDDARWRVEQAEAAEGRRILREEMPRDEALKHDRKLLEQDPKLLEQDPAVLEVCKPRKWKST